MKPKNVDPSFRDRLQRVMREQKLTQADLSRKVWGTTLEKRPDGQVYEVPKNRQTLTRYLAGKSYPSEETKQSLAEALGVRMAELFPHDGAVNRAGSGITLEPVNKRESLVSIHLVLPTEVALELVRKASEYAK